MSTTDVFVHPRGLCESQDVGAGTRIWDFTHVMAGAVIGRDCNICSHSFIEDRVVLGDRVTVKNHVLIPALVTIEDEVFIGPHATFTNDPAPRVAERTPEAQWQPTRVRRGASICAGAVLCCGIEIGEGAFIAAGSVVTRSVPDHAFVRGNPARQCGWACECGRRLAADGTCACGSRYPDRVWPLAAASGATE